MIRFSIDISIFTKDSSFGTISGKISAPILPQLGDSISFTLTEDQGSICDSQAFFGTLEVKGRIFFANEEAGMVISLSDIVADNEDDARSIMGYLEKNYGLIGDIHDLT